MRLVTFVDSQGLQRAGALIEQDTAVVDLQAAYMAAHGAAHPGLASVLALVEAGEAGLAAARDAIQRASGAAVLPRASVKLRAPIQPPPQMRDFSCFETHLRQSFAAARRTRAAAAPTPEAAEKVLASTGPDDRVIDTFKRQPIYYKCNRFAVVGADDDMVWPSYSKAMDFELEFGCYIAKPAKDVPREQARDYIFGYTIFNDFSARDAQAREMPGMLGPAKSKDFDTANVMGPCLVTADELPDPYNLTMIARVNGEEWGRGNSSTMHWKFEDLIAHLSRSETIHPGEFLGTGTVGNGCGLEIGRFLKPGDVVELEVQGIGVLRTRVTKPD